MNKEYAVVAEDVRFTYVSDDGMGNVTKKPALNGATLSVEAGSYVAVLGSNGSGKSTLAKIMDILETPEEGNVVVLGRTASDKENFWKIRENCAVVFQNPDNQIVGTTVEEDVAFGPENLGIPLPRLREIVDSSLEAVGLKELSKRLTSELSGGQKQKLAIAGALAMEPKVLILDEATAMLDPVSREEFLSVVEDLRKKRGMTVITITHDMTEAERCEYVFVMEKGRVIASGTPREIFTKEELLLNTGLELPVNSAMTTEIAKITGDIVTSSDIGDDDACADSICCMLVNAPEDLVVPEGRKASSGKDIREAIIEIDSLSYSYDYGKTYAINDINMQIYKGEVLGLVGKSGCGKTTLITHLNGLLRPTSGLVRVCTPGGSFLTSDRKHLKDIRECVGLVFQYPEYQLFEETVYKDVAYGLRKEDLTEEEKRSRVEEALRLVGLDASFMDQSPFELSGGQKRRVAMAGVLVMRPKVLVLDEPASGLDPRGKREMRALIEELRAKGHTIIIVSHNMDEVSWICDRICCLKEGRIRALKTPEELFSDRSVTGNIGIMRPLLYEFSDSVKSKIAKRLPGIVFENTRNNIKDEAASLAGCVMRYRREHHA